MINVGEVVGDALYVPSGRLTFFLFQKVSATNHVLAGLLRYVRLQAEGTPRSGSRRTGLVGGTYMAGKIKFQIWHLFILVPKFYCFCIKPSVFVY